MKPSLPLAPLGSVRTLLVATLLATTAAIGRAQIGAYPDPYDPARLLTLDLVLDPADWDLIRFDLTYDIEVPALFSADGEPAMLVAVRRKSATALPSELDPQKISMKIDVNEYVSGQKWHGVKKLSLENGDDVNVVTEGFAWYLHRLATQFAGSSYRPGLAAWARVRVNGRDLGVYVNVEHPNPQFLKNRGTYTKGETWLYKQEGVDTVELKGGTGNSPSYEALCYSPFRVGTAPACPSPSPTEVVAQINALLDVQAMLTQGAVDAFAGNPDALFSKGQNFFFIDSLGAKRSFAPWDLDAAFGNLSTTTSIYGTAKGPGRAYEQTIVDDPSFRPLYDATMHGLLDGPLREAALIAFLDRSEALLAGPLGADPNNQIGSSVGPTFDALRAWARARIPNVKSQLPPPSGGPPGKATRPRPADGAVSTGGTGLAAVLSWTPGTGATAHAVHLGTDPAALEFRGYQEGSRFEVRLRSGVTVHWRVDELSAYGTTTGDVWSFTTKPRRARR